MTAVIVLVALVAVGVCISEAYFIWRLKQDSKQPKESLITLLTIEDAKALDDRDPCTFCGGYHNRQCPRVKRITYGVEKTVQEVEFWPTWDDSDIIWPKEVQNALDQATD